MLRPRMLIPNPAYRLLTKMAHINHLIPFLIYFETGVRDSGADCAALFEKARRKGVASDPDDLGGATLAGVTIGTYAEYCRRKGRSAPTVRDLRNLAFPEWLDILKSMFWDRWLADNIDSQQVAEMLVDWVWTSGKYGISEPQRLLGVKPDGIVGPKTLAAVNSRQPSSLVEALRGARIEYTERICRARPANRKFRNGWLRRINACAP